MGKVKGDVIGREVSDERYLFARWLRRVMRKRGIRFSELRDDLGVDSRTFNRWMIDEPRHGSPEMPDEDQCKEIAVFLDVRPEFVIRLAERARKANEDVVLVIRKKDGEVVRQKEPVGS